MVKKYLAELGAEETFTDLLVLRSKICAKTTNGKEPKLKFSIFDGSKECKAKIWKATDSEIQEIMQSDFLLVSGRTDKLNPDFPDGVTIEVYETAQIPDDLEPFLSPFPDNHKVNQKRFSSLLQSIQDTNLNCLLRDIFNTQSTTWKEFKSASAAQFRHHAYRGGLLEHSVEVAELCDSSCCVLTHLRRDFLVTCALLHDIGKLEEMNHDLAAGEFTEEGTLVGHTVSGAHLIGSAADKIAGFPRKLKWGLMHMVLSHHGSPDWGAAQSPVCAEAFVLHECDNMSAKAHHYHKVFSAALPGQFSVKVATNEYYYVGDFGLQQAETKAVTNQPVPVFVIQPKQQEMVSSFTTIRIPIKALVAAGSPEQGSIEEDEESRDVVPPACGADYLVRVTGDSMADEGILESDLLFVKEIETPKDGDIVIAHLGASGEVVKRFRYDPTKTDIHEKKWLESENSRKNYPNLPIDNDTRIRGKVVGLLRDF